MNEREPDTMIIFSRTYDFVSWVIPLTLSFPRAHRFVVTLRLQNAALDFQEKIIEANHERAARRLAHLHAADAELTKIKLYLRLCNRWAWISNGQYREGAERASEMGRLLGGWIRQSQPPAV